jgi:hypothetical protein
MTTTMAVSQSAIYCVSQLPTGTTTPSPVTQVVQDREAPEMVAKAPVYSQFFSVESPVDEFKHEDAPLIPDDFDDDSGTQEMTLKLRRTAVEMGSPLAPPAFFTFSLEDSSIDQTFLPVSDSAFLPVVRDAKDLESKSAVRRDVHVFVPPRMASRPIRCLP